MSLGPSFSLFYKAPPYCGAQTGRKPWNFPGSCSLSGTLHFHEHKLSRPPTLFSHEHPPPTATHTYMHTDTQTHAYASQLCVAVIIPQYHSHLSTEDACNTML